jgi:Ca-activated chloride channel homolog
VINRLLLGVFTLLFLTDCVLAQRAGITQSYEFGASSINSLDAYLWAVTSGDSSSVESPSGSVSKMDLKAPRKARDEYDKAYQLLMKKDLQNAVAHFTTATTLYPNFVAAHNGLGSTFLNLGQNEQARAEFAQAVALDDHLPGSYYNLGRAELALKHYPAAVDSIQKASATAPLDLHLLSLLTYAQLMNRDYPATIATAQKVHERKHKDAAMVHLYAAAAWRAQLKFPEANQELDTFFREDPKSPATQQARQLAAQIKIDQEHPEGVAKVGYSEAVVDSAAAKAHAADVIRKLEQTAKENAQIAEVEASSETECTTCGISESAPRTEAALHPGASPEASRNEYPGLTLRSTVDEVSVFFAATDHGRSVSNLTGKDVAILDDHKAPAAITGFRNEAQLPLEIGLVIDTSSSVAGSFKFEQDAAIHFLQKAMTGGKDRAFVIGFATAVLLVQDFTNDQTQISHSIGQLVPSGGTALWDAVAFASDKLTSLREDQPLARVLVVISDGEDNSSSATFKQAIDRVQHGEVVVYTVSTSNAGDPGADTEVGQHALKTLAQLSGGATFSPGSVRDLGASLADLQEVIRSRYLISYKPALFQRDGHYRPIEISVQQNSHKLRVFARKGYFADANSRSADAF